MTCIIAQKSKNGVVLVADTRALRGAQAEQLDKIVLLQSSGVAFGLSGPKFILDKLIPILRKKPETEKTFDGFVDRAEAAAHDLYAKYRARRGEEWEPFGILVVGLDGLTRGTPRVSRINQRGFSEEVKTFEVIGHASDYAYPFVKMLYRKDASVAYILKASVYAISIVENLELDVTVGGFPDIVVVERNTPPRFASHAEIVDARYKFTNTWVKETSDALRLMLSRKWFHGVLWHFRQMSDEEMVWWINLIASKSDEVRARLAETKKGLSQ